MAVQSKPLMGYLSQFITLLRQNKLSFSALVIVIAMLINYKQMNRVKSSVSEVKITQSELDKINNKKSKGTVDKIFIQRIWDLLKIVIPSFQCAEFIDLVLLSICLYMRTLLSLQIANVKGGIVKGIITQKFEIFIKGLFGLSICAVPGSFLNSSLSFFNRRLSLNFRKRLSNYFTEKYLDDMVYYRITNIDQRIPNPDQRLTQDIEKWADSLSTLYSNISKPLLDIILLSKKLTEYLGWQSPIIVFIYYCLSGIILKLTSPVFGKLVAVEQKLEGQYRQCQNDIVKHSEEIAFFRGNQWEKSRVEKNFNLLCDQHELIILKRLYMGCFDTGLVRYGTLVVGYGLCSLPYLGIWLFHVKGPGGAEYIKNKDIGKLTRDYVRNSNLLIDLAAAIGRIIVSYKNVQLLAGYTALIYELKVVLQDIKDGRFERQQLEGQNSEMSQIRGEIVDSDKIQFIDVPIISPNGDMLVNSLNFQINPGMNCLISGPNGCGKSSMFRILGSLWPLYGGKVERPNLDKIFYIPQRPYLPVGTFRDQIIYPHKKVDQLRKKVSDKFLKDLLNEVHIGYLLEREGGFDAKCNWNDVLSGGEKQRLAMARLFYHKPAFAILDECTSSTSLDMESLMYNKCKDLNITLFTVSHRPSLFKFHDFILRFDGQGGWSFEKMVLPNE